jgi:hypothetical protein
MRAMVYRGPYKIRVEERDIPAIEHPNDAIVKVELAAICGSDLHLYHGMMPDTATGSDWAGLSTLTTSPTRKPSPPSNASPAGTSASSNDSSLRSTASSRSTNWTPSRTTSSKPPPASSSSVTSDTKRSKNTAKKRQTPQCRRERPARAFRSHEPRKSSGFRRRYSAVRWCRPSGSTDGCVAHRVGQHIGVEVEEGEHEIEGHDVGLGFFNHDRAVAHHDEVFGTAAGQVEVGAEERSIGKIHLSAPIALEDSQDRFLESVMRPVPGRLQRRSR